MQVISLHWGLFLLFCDPMNLPGSPVHGILQARILEWVAFPFSMEPSQPKDWTQVSGIAQGFFTVRATRSPQHQMVQVKPCP